MNEPMKKLAMATRRIASRPSCACGGSARGQWGSVRGQWGSARGQWSSVVISGHQDRQQAELRLWGVSEGSAGVSERSVGVSQGAVVISGHQWSPVNQHGSVVVINRHRIQQDKQHLFHFLPISNTPSRRQSKTDFVGTAKDILRMRAPLRISWN